MQIAADGGLLPTPVSSSNIPLAMAERIEIVVDFSQYPVGTKIILQNLNSKEISGEFSDQIMRFDVVRSGAGSPPEFKMKRVRWSTIYHGRCWFGCVS